MDPTALYSALNTIAQCAAALAALIGFLGLWRLDRLRGEQERVAGTLRGAFGRMRLPEVQDAMAYPTDRVLEEARKFVEGHPQSPSHKAMQPEVREILRQHAALDNKQQRLMGVLQGFLRRTFLILTLAIIGFVFANLLYAWILARWIVWLLSIVASISLYRHTAAVVREAASSLRTLVILVLLLALASPTWAAAPTRGLASERTLGGLTR